MSEPIISVQNLSKRYVIAHNRGSRSNYVALRDVLIERARDFAREPARFLSGRSADESRREDFWALKDVTFDVNEGDIVGIIGRNGAGKSTLLKILSRITEPTEGRVVLRGRVASLLEVGTGFHPELTGRENIFLNGSVLGMTQKEVKRKFDEIVAFAEIERFLDTPVKRYSSGMYVRLAFSVAAHLEPEILVVDEVLAVGDAEFQKKCLGKMDEVSRNAGRTVLFVSHNMGVVASICPRVVWLDRGRVHLDGDGRSVVNQYLTTGSTSEDRLMRLADAPRTRVAHDDRLRITEVEWLSSFPLRHGEPAEVVVRFRTRTPLSDVAIGLGFSSLDGKRLLTYETDFAHKRPTIDRPGTHSVTFRIDSLPTGPDLYLLDVGARSGDFHALDYLPGCVQIEVIPGPNTPATIVRKDTGIRLPSESFWEIGVPASASRQGLPADTEL